MTQTMDIITDDISGSQLASRLSGWRDAITSLHKGSLRPDYAAPGLMWIDDSADGVWRLNLFDGVSDVALGEIDPRAHTLAAQGGGGLLDIKIIRESGWWTPHPNATRAHVIVTGGGGQGLTDEGYPGSTAISILDLAAPARRMRVQIGDSDTNSYIQVGKGNRIIGGAGRPGYIWRSKLVKEWRDASKGDIISGASYLGNYWGATIHGVSSRTRPDLPGRGGKPVPDHQLNPGPDNAGHPGIVMIWEFG